MLLRYPNQWGAAYPTTTARELAMREWGKRLAGLQPEEIERGMNAWREGGPPSVYEFRAVCRPCSQPIHRPYRALPKPQPNPAIAAEEFARMRAVLPRQPQDRQDDGK